MRHLTLIGAGMPEGKKSPEEEKAHDARGGTESLHDEFSYNYDEPETPEYC